MLKFHMRYILFIAAFFMFYGCIFQPPVTIDDQIEVEKESEVLPKTFDQSTKDLLVDQKSERVLSLAYAQIGTPYLYGGSDFRGFDCSGFVSYVYKYAIGKKLPRSSYEQSLYVKRLERHELIPGDLVFFDTSDKGKINHCGIYAGNGRFIHASSGKVYSVTTSNLDRGFYKSRFKWGGRVDK